LKINIFIITNEKDKAEILRISQKLEDPKFRLEIAKYLKRKVKKKL